ncbi:expressed unknown protein [Seminavis robusta]|uniref:Uncharacterized protein n=1 Tax=Seminavis robusta TaxID=568900 RepID=A0A9N8DSE4_9STRA|nr:expressed unknown protein [Seminavis robusta]|eukprot:Sro254_g100070.1 n/a (182) ;mRNA; r:8538-9083
MTHQAEDNGSLKALPLRDLACRLDSTSTVSTLSFGSGYFTPGGDYSPMIPNRNSSIPRLQNLERFQADGGDRQLQVPGRKMSLHRIKRTGSGVDSRNSGSENDNSEKTAKARGPPCRPSRQDTADRKCFEEETQRPGLERVTGSANMSARPGLDRRSGGLNVGPDRPGLDRRSGGINVFSG